VILQKWPLYRLCWCNELKRVVIGKTPVTWKSVCVIVKILNGSCGFCNIFKIDNWQFVTHGVWQSIKFMDEKKKKSNPMNVVNNLVVKVRFVWTRSGINFTYYVETIYLLAFSLCIFFVGVCLYYFFIWFFDAYFCFETSWWNHLNVTLSCSQLFDKKWIATAWRMFPKFGLTLIGNHPEQAKRPTQALA